MGNDKLYHDYEKSWERFDKKRHYLAYERISSQNSNLEPLKNETGVQVSANPFLLPILDGDEWLARPEKS
jgi:gluconate kinase